MTSGRFAISGAPKSAAWLRRASQETLAERQLREPPGERGRRCGAGRLEPGLFYAGANAIIRGWFWAVSSAVEHCFHTAGVTGSIPVPPTTIKNGFCVTSDATSKTPSTAPIAAVWP